MGKKINIEMLQRRDTHSNWMTNNPILADGEFGYETDTKRLKIGDGVTRYRNLPFITIGINGEGQNSEIFNNYTNNKTIGNYSHAEGSNTTANGTSSHVEGEQTIAYGNYSHSEGCTSYGQINGYVISSTYDEISGINTVVTDLDYEFSYYILSIALLNNKLYKIESVTAGGESGNQIVLEIKSDKIFVSDDTKIILYNGGSFENSSHSEGYSTTSAGISSHSEGMNTAALGFASHSEGERTIANEEDSHAEGYGTRSNGIYSHAEGSNTTANGSSSHTEGAFSEAHGKSSHAEGESTVAKGSSSHVEGYSNVANGDFSHSEGHSTTTNGLSSHAEGSNTIASGKHQHVEGRFNIEDTENKYAHIIGNGDNNNRSNAFTVDWDGTLWSKGNMYVGGTDSSTGNKVLVEGSVYSKDETYDSETIDTKLSDIKNSAIPKYETKSSLEAIQAKNGDVGIVINDDESTNNGLYLYINNNWFKVALDTAFILNDDVIDLGDSLN